METTKATHFEAKKEAAYETLQKLKGVNAPEADIQQANIMFRFWEAMEQEAGESLGALLYEFAVLVNFDTKLLKPIADKDAGFWSDIEGMGFLDFQLKRLELERSNRQISLLQSIDITMKRLEGVFAMYVDISTPKEEILNAGSLVNRNPEELAEVGIEADDLGNLKISDDDIDDMLKDV